MLVVKFRPPPLGFGIQFHLSGNELDYGGGYGRKPGQRKGGNRDNQGQFISHKITSFPSSV
nr:MAG TPA: hypothetical protein [Caudoviricetes sp.]